MHKKLLKIYKRKKNKGNTKGKEEDLGHNIKWFCLEETLILFIKGFSKNEIRF